MDICLHTPRLTLRPLSVSDAPRVAAWAATPDWPGDLCLPRLDTETAARDGIRRRDVAEGGALGILRRGRSPGDDVLIGGIGWHPDSRCQGVVELCFFLDCDSRGQGLATEAVGTLVRWLLAERGMHKVTGRHIANDLAPGRVMQRVGMRCEGCLREQLLRGGVWQDVSCYGLLAQELPETAGAASEGEPVPAAEQSVSAEVYTDGELSLRRLEQGQTRVAWELLSALAGQSGGQRRDSLLTYPGFVQSLPSYGAEDGGVYLLWRGGEAIGLLCLRLHPPREGAPFPGQVYLALHPEAQGRGYATRGLRLLLQAARRLPVDELMAVTPRWQAAALMAQLHNGAYIDHEDDQAIYTCLPL